MFPFELSPQQLELVEKPVQGAIFLQGIAGTGKTTTAVARMQEMLRNGIRADSILVLVPQRTLAGPYLDALRDPTRAAGSEVTVVTLGGLARRMIELFWPLIAEEAGFENPERPPLFLTLETAQYYMAQIVSPLLEKERYFESISIQRNRLYSQILDNLNKAAVVGFSHEEIGARLKAAWIGETSQAVIYDQAQTCASLFRQACLSRNLLDFSLQIEVFQEHLWPIPLFQEYREDRFRHLVVDNLEEDTPVTHDLLIEWLPAFESALLIYDDHGGYRRFLGADPVHAKRLETLCGEQIQYRDSFVSSLELRAFGNSLSSGIVGGDSEISADQRSVVSLDYHRYQPQMLAWAAVEIASLIHDQDVHAGEIVVLAPFLSDALRFTLEELFHRENVPVRSHRPSRALREEPTTQCLLTFAALAFPAWGVVPTVQDIAHALTQAINDLDLVRAHLVAKVLYRKRDGIPTLEPFEQVRSEMQARLTYTVGERYERLRLWLEACRIEDDFELDHFLGRLFGEILSQAGYGFHESFDAGTVTANLIESVQKFRWVLERESSSREVSIGRAYLQMVNEGVVASQYIRSWETGSGEEVLLAPAYTFLMTNRPVDYQFWLDIGSHGWWERLYQPLTHPYVLSRTWKDDRKWTDEDEFKTRQDALATLALGLVNRCRKGIFFGLSELGEGGYEQRGPLLRLIHRVFLTSSQVFGG